MKHDVDFFNFYLGDVLTEYFWIALYKIANNNFNELLEFIKQPGIYPFCRTAVSDVICQTAIHQPERRSEAIDWYKKALNFFLNSEIEDNVIDSNVLGGLVGDILDIQGKELLPEIEKLYENNLIKGGDLDNALVIVEKESSQKEIDRIADLFKKEHRVYKGQGVLNDEDLIFPNEPARHKLLDLLGDLALSGTPLKGKILATRTGHAANVEFVKKSRREIKRRKSQNFAPEYDPNKTPLYDINDIKKILPHRPPFLLVDKITELTENEVIGVKNVTMNEPFFVGHFPSEPVMPGVLIIEAMAQAGGILVLNTVEDPESYLTYFLKIDKVKFKRKVVPGDTLILKLELVSPIRRGIANMKAQAFVGDVLVTEGELMAQIVKANKK